MQRLRTNLILGSLVILLAGINAHADTVFVANMTNSQENPPVTPTTSTGAPRPASFGTATFVLNDAQTALTMTATIFNIDVTASQTPDLNDNLTLAHIHAPAPPGSNTGVVWGFFGSPDNDNNPDNLVITPFANGVGGVFTSVWNQPEGQNTTLTAQLPNIFAGLSYINFHTVQFGGGEIRGQIQAVPEPATLLLLGTGLAGVAGRAMRRRGRK
jgi:hypothetical protein